MLVDDAGKSLTPVHICWSDHEAEIVVSFLAASDIPAITNSAVAHSIYPLTTDGLGEVQVLVAEDMAQEARRLLAECESLSNAEADPGDAGV